MNRFSPIAIVGRACILPGALTPADLWQSVVERRDQIQPVPEGRWTVDREKVLSLGTDGDGTVSDKGGYVDGFEDLFDSTVYPDAGMDVDSLDPLCHWLLHCSREALLDASTEHPPKGTGLIVGNLSYPTRGHADFAEAVWTGNDNETAVPANRFNSGLPVHIAANALHLDGDSFALDAACASSLYAVKLACDRLQDGAADMMLAGAVNRADDQFLHIGFTALQALSPTGRSRPFHREADGLLPAEGAGIVVLKRLNDAIRDGDRIHGVIRGIGLSNDGRQKGFLAPDGGGQIRAMRAAYEWRACPPPTLAMSNATPQARQ